MLSSHINDSDMGNLTGEPKKNSNSLKIREKMLLKLFQWVSASIVIGNKSIGVTVELELPPPQKR